MLAGHSSDVTGVTWHPNCHYVATSSDDRTVRLWDVAAGSAVRLLGGFRAGAAPTGAMAFSPDGRHLAAGADDGRVLVWDLGSARRVATLEGHTSPVWTVAYSHGARSPLLATAGADETVRLWGADVADPAAAQAAAAARAARGGGASARSAQRLLASCCSSAPAVYCPLAAYRTKSSPPVSLAFSPRNLLLAAGAFSVRGGG
eukprot:264972-Chlamydomonas_euryale.AAC.8